MKTKIILTETFIYTLTDPITNKIRYVGKTNNIDKRYKQHINLNNIRNNTHRDNWIKKLIKNNLYPIMEILDVVPNNNWPYWEIFWIAQIKLWGFELTNIGIGGEGGNCTEETKKKISLKNKGNKYRLGTKHTPQQLLNISNSLIGIKQSSETINKRAISNFKDIDIIKLKEEYDKMLTYAELGLLFNLSASKIYRTLKQNNLLNNKNKTHKRVICVETGKIYSSVSDAKKNDASSSIFNALKYGLTSKGCHWKYID